MIFIEKSLRFKYNIHDTFWEVDSVYNIVICDDEETLIDELKENLIKYAAETNKEFCFFIYHDGSELLQEYRS